MPTLEWIGKKSVLNHHKKVPYHLLKYEKELSIGDPGSGNLLVGGDNLIALKALLPYYAEKVKCIYIDPPYNTGEQSWSFNDSVNSPEIKAWLGQTVGSESKDLTRHDKWLCMMYPRLKILRQFLRKDGVIFISIDETEIRHLRLLMDELFGVKNDLGALVWKRRSSSAMRALSLSIDHEYILAYAKNITYTSLYGQAKGLEGYPFKDKGGNYASTDLTVGMDRYARPNQFYPITNPRTGKTYQPNPERVWRFIKESMSKVILDDLIIWPDEAKGKLERPRYKTYFNPKSEKQKPISSWIESSNVNDRELLEEENDYGVEILTSGMNQEGGKLAHQILRSKAFSYPKPISLIRSLVRASTKNDDIILDSFAGSGTTGHAALSLNNEDNGSRRFILIEMEDSIAKSITHKRLKKVIKGYRYKNIKGKTTSVLGLGGGLVSCALGPSLFDQSGQIRDDVGFSNLAHHVYFSETGEPIPERTKKNSPLLGIHNGTAIYLLFNGVLGDNAPRGGNVLTPSVFEKLPLHEGLKIIFGASCRLSQAQLKCRNIIFRQIPYELKVG